MPIELSARQRRILVLAANGYTNDAIAAREGIAAQSVGRNLQRIGEKLGGRGRAHTVAIAVLTGLLRPADIHLPTVVDPRPTEAGPATYHYTDPDGDELVVTSVRRYGRPAISLRNKPHDLRVGAAVHVPLTHVRELLDGIRDTARQAATEGTPR